jgi:hypothetical protein
MFLYTLLVFGQQAKVVKPEKITRSMIEAMSMVKTENDSIEKIAKNNVNSIFRLNNNNSIFGQRNLNLSEIQKNAYQAIQNNMNFNHTINGVYVVQEGKGFANLSGPHNIEGVVMSTLVQIIKSK